MASTHTCAHEGVDTYTVRVEARISPGLPRLTVVGLPDAAVREGRERVRAAIRATDCKLLVGRQALVNLSPASRRKAGASFDLAIAVALLAAGGQCPAEPLLNSALLGELGLDGRLHPVPGVLPATLAARREGFGQIVVPTANAREAAVGAAGSSLRVFAADTLAQVIGLVHCRFEAEPATAADNDTAAPTTADRQHDLAEVKGQFAARRALEIAAAGRHHILMIGPPGAGKSMLARRLPGLLPDLGRGEAIETTSIYSIANLDTPGSLILRPPLRAPHHTTSGAGLVGGGAQPRPGEISLAHDWVLFLDELPEFSRSVLNQLREPLEDGHLTICRASGRLTFPARFLLVAAMNPCPCGYMNSGQRPCICPEATIARYRQRVSGPLLDRIDIHVSLPRVPFEQLEAKPSGESSACVRARVAAVHKLRAGLPVVPHLRSRIDLVTSEARQLLGRAVDGMGLSARAVSRVLNVARTIADLADDESIQASHLGEALQYRPGPLYD